MHTASALVISKDRDIAKDRGKGSYQRSALAPHGHQPHIKYPLTNRLILVR